MPTTPILIVRVPFNARCDRAHRRPVATKIPEQEHPQGKTPVRAIALSISCIPVAAPAPDHDPPPPPDDGSSRAHEKTRRACGTRTPYRRIDRAAIASATRQLIPPAPAATSVHEETRKVSSTLPGGARRASRAARNDRKQINGAQRPPFARSRCRSAASP